MAQIATPAAAPVPNTGAKTATQSGAPQKAHAHRPGGSSRASAPAQNGDTQPEEADDAPSAFEQMVREMAGSASAQSQTLVAGAKDKPIAPQAAPQPAAEPDGDAQGPKPQAATGAAPSLLRGALPLPARAAKAGADSAASFLFPVNVPVAPQPIRLRLPVSGGAGEERSGESRVSAKTEKISEQSDPVSAGAADNALHINIRMSATDAGPTLPPLEKCSTAAASGFAVNPAGSAQTKNQQTGDPDAAGNAIAVVEPQQVRATQAEHAIVSGTSAALGNNAGPVAASAPAAPSAPVAAAEIRAEMPREQARAASEPPPPAATAHLQEPPSGEPANRQPLRSVSLEFTPDGARDVKLRLSERSGEVHVSLHSTDPSFTGKLHEGVHDLIGSLAHAGYDAEAWGPDQGRQNRQQQPEQPPRENGNGGAGSGEEFAGLLQQPVQENS